MKAFFTLGKLSAEEKNLLLKKQITDAKTPDQWLAFFQKLRDFDKESDSTRKWTGGIGCAGFFVIFFSFFLMAIYVGFLTIFIGLFMVIAGLAAYFYIKKYDIPGEVLTNTLIPILKILREEMKPSELLKLKLDLRGFALKEKLTNQSQPYQRGAYYSIIDYFYKDQWFDGETVLADGTILKWNVFDYAKQSKKSKRTPRGKYKSKTKNKHRSFISMTVGMHEKKYELPEKLKQKDQVGNIRTKESGDYNWMNIKKMIKHWEGQTFSAQDFANAVAIAYTRATPTGGKK
ncbi:MAG TPA: hypothetical protein PKY82_08365 [Pyrinomonadaceae bacterium]|nr:hypothetical protein [Pyrinomonadaceae bacterium]